MNILQALDKLTQVRLDQKLTKNKENKESEWKCFQNGGTHCKEVIALPNVMKVSNVILPFNAEILMSN